MLIKASAGGGGKGLALAASMALGEKIEGSLWACDISAYRLERLTPRLQRAGAEEVNTKVVAALNDPWVTNNSGTFDRVLTDVPSTGTGTWRRDPDARWRFTPANLDDLLAVQQRILEMAQTLVKPGGRLSLQKHKHRAEHWVVVSGTARVTRGEEVFDLGPNESTYIPVGTLHRLENPAIEVLRVIEIQSGDYLGEDDIERFDDVYGRADL